MSPIILLSPQAVTRKVRILDVNYNASNNELVRTQTLVKNAIVQVDATPFKQWYQKHYNVELGAKKDQPDVAPKPEEIQVRVEAGRGRRGAAPGAGVAARTGVGIAYWCSSCKCMILRGAWMVEEWTG